MIPGISSLFGGFDSSFNFNREPAGLVYRTVEKNRTDYEVRFDRLPQAKRDVTYFRAHIGSVKSSEDLLRNWRLLEFTLGAFQLDSEIESKGILRKLMSDSLDDPRALANRLVDPRFKQFATAFSGIDADPSRLTDPGFVDAIVGKWRTNAFEIWQGERNPAVREAMYFARTVTKVETLWQVISDRVLAKVARTALNLPDAFGALSARKQFEHLSRRLDPADFQDPVKVRRLLDRFLANTDIAAGASGFGVNQGLIGLFRPGGRFSFNV